MSLLKALVAFVEFLTSAHPSVDQNMRFLLLPACFLILSSRATTADEIDFAHEIVPILKQHCAECHTGQKSEGGFSFNTQRQLLESGYIEAGNPEESRLMQLIQSVDVDDQMPPKDRNRLSAAEVASLRQWIAAGVAWEPGFRFAKSAYEPPLKPRQVQLPEATSPDQNPIDRILQAHFNEHQIPVPSLVNDETFLRRAYLDIIGLPPSVAELRQFAAGQSGDRNEAINRVLFRNHDYAEHWISFWNDLLRNDYVGTGYIDGGRKQITDWLYRSLVNNKPYDQFVRELISPDDEAAGFINGIKWRGNVNASQVTEIQFSQNVSQVFLGINMKCASCHDSFIDRWTLDEAYGLAAIYSTRELEIHRCDKPVGRVAKASWIFPEIGDVDPTAEQPERLKQLAVVMTSPENGRFARTIVNRLWHRLMGHGIVHPVDAMETKPWNEDLLDYLANYLVQQKYDLKAVLRLIASSQAYQSQSAAAQDSATSEEFVFQGPIARHLTAEQFVDCVWAVTSSAPRQIDAPVSALDYSRTSEHPEKISGQWIWSYADTTGSPAGEQAAFRTTLSVPAKPKSAMMAITCDNEYNAWVNGKKVGGDKDWGSVEVIDIGRHMTVGDNEIFIVGKNAGASPNPAGLYAEIVLTDDDGQRTRHPSDTSWQASRKVPKPTATDKAEWAPAAAVVPQGFLGPQVADSLNAEVSSMLGHATKIARASLLKSNLLMRSLGRPNREQVVTVRPASVSTLQAIDLANGEVLNGMLQQGATNLISEADQGESFVVELFEAAVSRKPSGTELNLAMSLLGEQPTPESVQDLLWLVVMLPEFQFVQ